MVPARDSNITKMEFWPKLEKAPDRESLVEIPISSLSISDSPRLRGESAEHVRALAAAHVDLPPILVHRHTMRVIDGVHRVRVAQLLNKRTITARFFDGDEEDAFVLAVKSNVAHGLPLSLADKKYAAGRIITSHPQWSDRMIATVTGLAAKTIADIRKSPSVPDAAEDARIGRDGRIRPTDATERRKAALELIQENPSLPLREIARIVGISPETVRDVRNRLLRGEDPLTRRQSSKPENRKFRTGEAGQAGTSPTQPMQENRVAVLQRLRADPAVRFSESGRTLLRMLYLHAMSDEAWEKIVRGVPPHCHDAIAHLAREHADMWLEFAERVERKIMNSA
jgi:ParB-like chromosome segregation protein Spo0J